MTIDKAYDGVIAYIASIGMVGAATCVCYLLDPIVAPASLSLVFLTAVLFSALHFGLWPSLMTALIGEASWNYFFVPPKFSLTIQNPQDLLAIFLFLIVSLVVSNQAALLHRRNEALAARGKITAQLYDFSQKIASTESLKDLLAILPEAIGAILARKVAIVLPDADGLRLDMTADAGTPLAAADINAAHWCWSHAKQTGRGTDILPQAERLFLPLATQRGTIGVMSIDRPSAQQPPIDELPLPAILADQTAVAIERARLAEAIDNARLQTETERLRNAMLTSVSHDLRTPLTTIIAAHSTLKSLGDDCAPATRWELVDRAQSEAERLNRLIGNLLDMTRLESGRLGLTLGPIDIGETLESALARANQILRDHTVSIDLPDDLPMVDADFLLLDQIFFNVIDNAAKYTQPRTEISISAYSKNDSVVIEIADEGEGIPPHALEKIFDKFARIRLEDRRQPGTGLGLAICRGFAAAMGGTILAHNRQKRSGAVFAIQLAQSKIPMVRDFAETHPL